MIIYATKVECDCYNYVKK